MQSEETETAVSEEEALEDRMLTVAVFEDTGTLNRIREKAGLRPGLGRMRADGHGERRA